MVTKVKMIKCTGLLGIAPCKYIIPKILSRYNTTSKTNAAVFTRPLAKGGKIRPNISTIFVALTVDITTGLYGLTMANCIKKRKNTSKIATLIIMPKICAEFAPILERS